MASPRTLPMLLFLAAVPFCALEVRAQSPPFVLNGVVKSRDTHLVLAGTTIIATDTIGEDTVAHTVSTRADKRGKYKLSLPYDHVYSVEYWSQGCVTKRVIIDLMRTRGKDQEGGNTMTLEITLFAAIARVDYSAFKAPVAICRFDRKEKKFLWDEDYNKEREPALETVKKEQVAAQRAKGSSR